MTDPISDMLTRIRNASILKKAEIIAPASKIKFGIAKILEQTHWVESVEKVERPSRKNAGLMFDEIKIVLKYNADGKPAISGIKRVSKPSRRVYVGKTELPRVLNNMGIAIISTPQGLMTNKEAGRRGLGGEVLCEIF